MNSKNLRSYKIPEYLQNLINEVKHDLFIAFNQEHRKKFIYVLNDLIITTTIRNEREKFCANCQDFITEEEQMDKIILFHKYHFCCQYCSRDFEYHIRKSWRISNIKMHKKKLFKK